MLAGDVLATASEKSGRERPKRWNALYLSSDKCLLLQLLDSGRCKPHSRANTAKPPQSLGSVKRQDTVRSNELLDRIYAAVFSTALLSPSAPHQRLTHGAIPHRPPDTLQSSSVRVARCSQRATLHPSSCYVTMQGGCQRRRGGV